LKVEISRFPAVETDSFLAGDKVYSCVHCKNPSWILFREESRICDAFPIEIESIINTEWFTAKGPAGFSGPRFYSEFKRFEPLLVEELSRRKIVSLYLLGRPEANSREGEIINYVVNLKDGVEGVVQGMKRDSRSRVRKLKNRISETQIVRGPTYLKEFTKSYEALAQKLSFPQIYRFSFEEFATLESSSFIDLVNVVDAQGHWLCGAYVGKHGSTSSVDYLYSAVESEVTDGSRLLLCHLYEYYSRQQITHFNLGGGISENDSLALFKLSMGGKPWTCHRFRLIVDLNQYKHFEETLPLAPRGFFPSFSIG